MTLKKIMITGSSGMLGNVISNQLSGIYECVGVDIQPPQSNDHQFIKCDLTDKIQLESVFNSINPAVIVHCAAIVSVDACETNTTLAENLHIKATDFLAKMSKLGKSHLIYISSDLVFDGKKKKPYTEDDSTNPLNVYARTKLEGESCALNNKNSLVLRTNIFGWTVNKKSFAEWVLKGIADSQTLTMFSDVLFTPISTYCLSEIIQKCIEQEVKGLFHATSRSVLSKYDFALKVASEFGLPTDYVKPVSKDDVNLLVTRPGNMALESSKLSNRLDMVMPDIVASIRRWKENQPYGV
jgi:dTDP-4-dehydrorhamnose reductase